ncbi:MAG: hypothetical protein KDE03_14080 [Rhodobacteraceae bacterium]|nr:hypothetical protein [Paracoccaceae bacterium]
MRTLVLSCFAALVLALSACTETTGGGAGVTQSAFGSSAQKTAAEKALEKEAQSLTQVTRNIVVKNTVEGAVMGALAGCGLALLMGGGGDDCARGAMVGGVVGGVAGNQVGQKAAAVKKELVRQDAIIANLKGINSKLNGVESNLRKVVNAQNSEIRSLQRQVANKQISSSAYNSRIKAINSNRQTVINALAKSESNVANSRTELVSLERQSGQKLSSSKAAATSTQNRLAALRKSVKLVGS